MVKGGTELLQDPVAQELLASRIPARLAYNWTDGTPRVVSLWFHWDGTDLVMASLPAAPKLKALRTGDRVAVTIDTNDPPHHILSIRGAAEVTEVQGVVAEYGQAAVRYLVGSGARPMLGRCRRRSGWVVSRCILTRWWSWTSRRASRARCRPCGGPSRWRMPPHRSGGWLARMGPWGPILPSLGGEIEVEQESPHVDPGQEARRVIDELSSSVWAFAALTAALEAGLLEPLAEPQELGAVSGRSGLDPALAEGLLDVLVALGLARRDGQMVVAASGLTPLLGSEAKEVLLAQLRSTDLQARQLVDAARHGSLVPGWQHTDPELLEAQGRSGKGAIPAMVQAIRQVPELEARLGQPSASFLDVGVGVGVIAIELCRAFPALRVVGLEPAAAPLAQARANVAAAQLADRIELRHQGVEELQDCEAFDLAYVAQVFIPDGVFEVGLARAWRALRPGGWVNMPAISATGEDREAALSRLRNLLWGGGARLPEQVAECARAVGFTGVQVVPGRGGTFRAIVGQRPA